MKRNLEIKIGTHLIKSVKDLKKLDLSKAEKIAFAKQLNKLLDEISDKKESQLIIELKKENEILKAEVKKQLFKNGIDNVLIQFHQQNFASAAADLLINPNPVEIHGTKAGRGLDFLVPLMQILCIKSDVRQKTIYLKQPLIPKEGGLKETKVLINTQKLDFPGLLFSIQKRAHHLLRVNISFAVNIYHYSLDEKGFFVLNTDAPKGFNENLIKIKTDTKFDANLYQTRLLEIDRLAKHHKDFAVNAKKIEEINKYKKSQSNT